MVSHCAFYEKKNLLVTFITFFMFALFCCCLIHSIDEDASNTPEVGQKGDNTSAQDKPLKTCKRIPKKMFEMQEKCV